jgi:hypothetical protein
MGFLAASSFGSGIWTSCSSNWHEYDTALRNFDPGNEQDEAYLFLFDAYFRERLKPTLCCAYRHD